MRGHKNSSFLLSLAIFILKFENTYYTIPIINSLDGKRHIIKTLNIKSGFGFSCIDPTQKLFNVTKRLISLYKIKFLYFEKL